MKAYRIEQREDGEHWISLERLRDSIREQRTQGRLTPYQHDCLQMAATLVDALLLEVGVEREDHVVNIPVQ